MIQRDRLKLVHNMAPSLQTLPSYESEFYLNITAFDKMDRFELCATSELVS